MIAPQETDIGRRVVHQPQRSAPEYGVISAITPRRVFVRFGSQLHSRAVSAADLEFHEPSRARQSRLQRRSVTESSPPLAPPSDGDHSRF